MPQDFIYKIYFSILLFYFKCIECQSGFANTNFYTNITIGDGVLTTSKIFISRINQLMKYYIKFFEKELNTTNTEKKLVLYNLKFILDELLKILWENYENIDINYGSKSNYRDIFNFDMGLNSSVKISEKLNLLYEFALSKFEICAKLLNLDDNGKKQLLTELGLDFGSELKYELEDEPNNGSDYPLYYEKINKGIIFMVDSGITPEPNIKTMLQIGGGHQSFAFLGETMDANQISIGPKHHNLYDDDDLKLEAYLFLDFMYEPGDKLNKSWKGKGEEYTYLIHISLLDIWKQINEIIPQLYSESPENHIRALYRLFNNLLKKYEYMNNLLDSVNFPDTSILDLLPDAEAETKDIDDIINKFVMQFFSLFHKFEMFNKKEIKSEKSLKLPTPQQGLKIMKLSISGDKKKLDKELDKLKLLREIMPEMAPSEMDEKKVKSFNFQLKKQMVATFCHFIECIGVKMWNIENIDIVKEDEVDTKNPTNPPKFINKQKMFLQNLVFKGGRGILGLESQKGSSSSRVEGLQKYLDIYKLMFKNNLTHRPLLKKSDIEKMNGLYFIPYAWTIYKKAKYNFFMVNKNFLNYLQAQLPYFPNIMLVVDAVGDLYFIDLNSGKLYTHLANAFKIELEPPNYDVSDLHKEASGDLLRFYSSFYGYDGFEDDSSSMLNTIKDKIECRRNHPANLKMLLEKDKCPICGYAPSSSSSSGVPKEHIYHKVEDVLKVEDFNGNLVSTNWECANCGLVLDYTKFWATQQYWNHKQIKKANLSTGAAQATADQRHAYYRFGNADDRLEQFNGWISKDNIKSPYHPLTLKHPFCPESLLNISADHEIPLLKNDGFNVSKFCNEVLFNARGVMVKQGHRRDLKMNNITGRLYVNPNAPQSLAKLAELAAAADLAKLAAAADLAKLAELAAAADDSKIELKPYLDGDNLNIDEFQKGLALLVLTAKRRHIRPSLSNILEYMKHFVIGLDDVAAIISIRRRMNPSRRFGGGAKTRKIYLPRKKRGTRSKRRYRKNKSKKVFRVIKKNKTKKNNK